MHVLVVCMGNICRSPTAVGVCRAVAERRGLGAKLRFDGAGTVRHHVGEPPDPRTQKAALARGYDLSGLRARRVDSGDFARFDRILSVDRHNLDILRTECPPHLAHKLGLFLDVVPGWEGREVPDPYYGGPSGFELVLDQCERAAERWVDVLGRALESPIE